MSDNELTEAQRRYYENLQNASPGTLSPTQYGNSLVDQTAAFIRDAGMLIEQSEARAKSARRWMWFWFFVACAEQAAHQAGH